MVIRKLCILGISVFFEGRVRTQSALVLLVVIILIAAQNHYKPWRNDTIYLILWNHFPLSHLVLFSSVVSYCLNNNTSTQAMVIISVLMVLTTLVFFIFFAYHLIIALRQRYFRRDLDRMRNQAPNKDCGKSNGTPSQNGNKGRTGALTHRTNIQNFNWQTATPSPTNISSTPSSHRRGDSTVELQAIHV